MNKTMCTCVAALALLATPAAFAGVGAGDVEAGLNVSLVHTKTSIDTGAGTFDSTSDNGTIGGNVGYFITDMLEFKLAATGTVTSSAGTKTTTGTINPGLDVVFLGTKGKVAPFIGASYAKSWGDTAGPVDTDYYDGHAGVKFFIKEKASLEVKLARYEATEDAAMTGHTDLSVGLNVYF
jgi:hypothetical protein